MFEITFGNQLLFRDIQRWDRSIWSVVKYWGLFYLRSISRGISPISRWLLILVYHNLFYVDLNSSLIRELIFNFNSVIILESIDVSRKALLGLFVPFRIFLLPNLLFLGQWWRKLRNLRFITFVHVIVENTLRILSSFQNSCLFLLLVGICVILLFL